ncbi:MAG: DEAD/DEAH box helicase [Planctomycetota bacterium]
MFALIGLTAVLAAVASVVIGAGGAYGAYRTSSLGRARRRALAQVRPIARANRRCRHFLERLRRGVAKAVARFGRSRRQRLIAETPIEELRGQGVGSIRWGALETAGVRTLGDLADWPPERLTRIDGVGAKSAESLHEKAAQLRTRLAQAPLPPPAPALDEPGARELARRALRSGLARRELGDVAVRLQVAHQTLEDQGREVKRATGVWAWVRSWWQPRRREDGVALASNLERSAEATARSGVLEDFATRERRARAAVKRTWSPAELVRDYQGQLPAVAATMDEAVRAAVPLELDRPEIGAVGRAGLTADDLASIQSTALHSHTMSIGLRRYQEFGTKFVLTQRRTVLGDEMGLGKTVQALAAMAQIWALQGKSHFVVVAPAGIMINWCREIEDKSFLRARLAHGAARDQTVRDWLSGGGVLVTSYATLRSFDLDNHLQDADQTLDLLVADEAHYVKNPEAQRSLALARLVARADRVCLMTGTPMENHPREFARLVDLIRPGELSLSEDELDLAHSGSVASRFQRDVAGIYLRRNQEDVLHELPPLIEVDDWVQLSGPEDREYRSAVEAGNFMGMRQAVTLGVDGDLSTKLERLGEILAEHREAGRKVLVFSFFIRVLERVAELTPHVGLIRGSVSQADRAEMIDSFREAAGHQVLLAQITAAGHGLNLQMASAVILMEPQLTPGAEAQAIARAHRMGQTQRVLVHRLLAADTVDERLVAVLHQKAELFDDYARHSLAKDRNPEATETQVIRKIIQLEQDRVRST